MSVMNRTLAVSYRPVTDLIPYAGNARTHSDVQVAEIAASIRAFGFTNPLLVDGANGIIAGHGRLLAARKLGMTEVPVIELAGMSEAEARPVKPSGRVPVHARQVEAMAGYGLPAKDIAIVLGIDAWALERDYQTELKAGAIKANAKVAESLFRRATGEGREGVVAAIFWLKTRAGWRETTVHEVRPYSHMSVEEIDARISEVVARIEAVDPGWTARLTSAANEDAAGE